MGERSRFSFERACGILHALTGEQTISSARTACVTVVLCVSHFPFLRVTLHVHHPTMNSPNHHPHHDAGGLLDFSDADMDSRDGTGSEDLPMSAFQDLMLGGGVAVPGNAASKTASDVAMMEEEQEEEDFDDEEEEEEEDEPTREDDDDESYGGEGRRKGKGSRKTAASSSKGGATASASPGSTPASGAAAPTTGRRSEFDARRLKREQNRESARKSRLKKKEYTGSLRDTIKGLAEEVNDLRVEHAADARAKNRSKMLAAIGRGAYRDALAACSPAAPERRTLTQYRIENHLRVIAPSHARFLSWVVDRRAAGIPGAAESSSSALPPLQFGGGGAADPLSSPTEAWRRVCDEVGFDEAQRAQLAKVFRSKSAVNQEAEAERARLQFVVESLSDLSRCVDTLALRTSDLLSRFLTVLTDEQRDKLYHMVSEFGGNNGGTVVPGGDGGLLGASVEQSVLCEALALALDSESGESGAHGHEADATRRALVGALLKSDVRPGPFSEKTAMEVVELLSMGRVSVPLPVGGAFRPR